MEKSKKTRSSWSIMASLAKLVRPLSGVMSLAVLAGLAGHLCAAFITIFAGYGLLNVLNYDSMPLTVIFVCMAAFAILRGLLRYAEQSGNHYIAFKLLALIRDKVFGVLRTLAPAKLEGKDKGDLIALITSDIELLEVFYAHTISPTLIALLFTVIMCLFIGQYSWLLALLALAAYLTVGILVPLIASKASGKAGLHFRKQSGELSSYVLDSLRGLLETIQYGKTEQRLHGIETRTEALCKEEKKLKDTAGYNAALTNSIILLFDLAMLFASASLYAKGEVTFAGVLIPTLALMSSFGPVVALANLGSTLQNTFAAGNRVLDLLEEEPSVKEITGKNDVAFEGAATENITFAYTDPNGKPGDLILDDVSFDFDNGDVIGISGKSGSGKSTLLKLLMRFWKPQKGHVKISGTDIEEINTYSLRNIESALSQETYLFHDTIRNNIAVAKPNATDQEIEDAAKKASVHEFILSLPNGYNTQVGELGDTLSGGEKQRIGLARAFLHDADFLLLDEPTSNLDSLNEAVILKSLKEKAKDKTIVLVSHRPSTLRIADTICKLDQGRSS
jgi:ATP-binding cassette subfamily C protein